jgi:hypothetical protein
MFDLWYYRYNIYIYGQWDLKPPNISGGGPTQFPPSIVHGSREAFNDVLEAATFDTSCGGEAFSCKWFQATAN